MLQELAKNGCINNVNLVFCTEIVFVVPIQKMFKFMFDHLLNMNCHDWLNRGLMTHLSSTCILNHQKPATTTNQDFLT